jgi:hypothetical protein
MPLECTLAGKLLIGWNVLFICMSNHVLMVERLIVSVRFGNGQLYGSADIKLYLCIVIE